jgi:hypothetical protein
VWCEKPSFLLLGVHPTWWSHLQIDQADAEAGAVTAGLLGATSRPPLCGVYQGGLSPPLHGMSLGTPESMWRGSVGTSGVEIGPFSISRSGSLAGARPSRGVECMRGERWGVARSAPPTVRWERW